MEEEENPNCLCCWQKLELMFGARLDMPTAHNSPIYKDDFPKLDAASIILLRHAGVLFLG